MGGYMSPGPTRAIVSIGAVDTENRLASGTFGDGAECGNIINLRNPVGAVQVTPAVGEQWVIERQGDQWLLVSQLPVHTPQLDGTTKSEPGQVQIGSSGPLEFFGSSINAHGPMTTGDVTTADITIPEGNRLILNGMYFRTHENRLQYSADEETWTDVAAVGDIPAPLASTDELPEGTTNQYYTAERASAAAPVQSVNTQTGVVVVTPTTLGLGNVANLAPADLPLSTASITALGSKADLVSGVVQLTQLPDYPTSRVIGLDSSLSTLGTANTTVSTNLNSGWNWVLSLFGIAPQGSINPGAISTGSASLPQTNVTGLPSSLGSINTWGLDSWNWLLSLFGVSPQGSVNPGTVSTGSTSLPQVRVSGLPTSLSTINTWGLDVWNWVLSLFGVSPQGTINPGTISTGTTALPQARVSGLPSSLSTINTWGLDTWNWLLSLFGISPQGSINPGSVSTGTTALPQARVSGLPTSLGTLSSGVSGNTTTMTAVWNWLLGLVGISPQGTINTGAVPSAAAILPKTNVQDLPTLNTGFNQVTDIFNGLVVTPINSAIAGIIDWWNGLIGFRDTTASNQVNQQNFAISTLANNNARNPAWVCRYQIGDVSYPDFFNAKTQVFGTTEAASAGTAHTHDLIGDNVTAFASYWSVTQTQATGSIITISNTTQMDSMAVNAYKQSGAIDNVFLELFRIATSTGAAIRLASINIAATLTTSAQYIEVDLPSKVATVAGERYIVRVRNSSTTAVTVNVQGVASSTGQQDTGLRWSGGNELLTSYTAAQITTALSNTAIVLWTQLAAKNPQINDVSYSDNFDRGDMGSLWSLKSNVADNLSISGGRIAYTNSSTGAQNGLFVGPTSTDASSVEANLYFIFGAPSAQQGILLHCNRDLSQIVYLAVGQSTMKIFSGSSVLLTQRATGSWTAFDGTYGMYYDTVNDKYVTTFNGDATGLEWTGASSAVTHGADYRFGGVRIECASLAPAGQIDSWTLRDFHP